MSEVDMMVITPGMMKPYVWLQTYDGSIQQVEQEIAMYCPLIYEEIMQKGLGSSKNSAICLPQRISLMMLSLILDYCRFHQVPGRSNKERKSYDEKFVRMDAKQLCELTACADCLQLKPLVDLTSRALARVIDRKSPSEIREIFDLPDDLTEEEKLEPLKNINDDPRIRLLNRLYAKKRKELKESKRLKNVEVETEHVDERTVDDLMSFINGNDEDPKGKTSKKKKKNRKKKERQRKNSSPKEASEVNTVVEVNDQNLRQQSPEADRIAEDSQSDEEFDPVLMDAVDREVEHFTRILNTCWPERMQDFLSSGRERNTTPFTPHGSSFRRRDAYFGLLELMGCFWCSPFIVSFCYLFYTS